MTRTKRKQPLEMSGVWLNQLHKPKSDIKNSTIAQKLDVRLADRDLPHKIDRFQAYV
jgi:hypothetical protein